MMTRRRITQPVQTVPPSGRVQHRMIKLLARSKCAKHFCEGSGSRRRRTEIKNSRFVATRIAGQQTVPVESAKGGPRRYRTHVDLFCAQLDRSVPNLFDPA